jgi:flagellar hook-associated protein 3 FlgL
LSGATAGYDLLGRIVADSAIAKQRLDTLTEQASSGLIADTYAGLGGGATTALALQAAVEQQRTWSDNIGAVTGQMGVAQTALKQISSIASSFYAQANSLNNLDPSAIDTIAADARSALVEVAGLLDTTDGGSYVFAGQDSQNPPVPVPDNILSSVFATQIGAAVANLASAGPAATIAATLGIASSNATGTSPFSPALSQPEPAQAGLRASVQIGAGQHEQVGILASANAAAVSTGSSTTGSYTRDIMRALATLGSLNGGMVLAAGFSQIVADTATSLSGAIGALNADAGVMGDQQASLQAHQTALGDMTTALKAQLSTAEDADLASTLSQLSAVQTRLQASYQLIAGSASLSLTKYLTTTM